MTALYLPARAKLNLSLRIVGRRADGYHLLDTLFHTLALHDDVWLQRGGDGVALAVTADAPHLLVEPGPDNLVARALVRLTAAAGVAHGFVAHLHKRIPNGGGLGGGSSDAAAVLRLGNALLDQPLPPQHLHDVARSLGADVPFFLRGGSQWGRGIGDELTPTEQPHRWFVLIVPPFGCPTVDVYKSHAAHWKQDSMAATVPRITVPDTGDPAVRNAFHNDLESAAERVRPELAELRRRVVELGCRTVRMTGSGSTLFVAGDDEASARASAAALQPLHTQGVRLLVTCSAPPDVDAPHPPDRPDGKGLRSR